MLWLTLTLFTFLVVPTCSIEPIVIIPGLAATQLDSTQVNAAPYFLCSSDRPNPYRIWFSFKESVVGLPCLIENTRLNYDTVTNCTIQGRSGSTITAHDWGNTTGIESLDPGSKIDEFVIFRAMVNKLVNDNGYERGISIRGAPYDFRLWGDECYSTEFLRRLQKLIEDTFSINGNVPVRLVCHSMGCPATTKLLVEMSSAWKKKYVTGIVALGAPFAGAPSVIYSVVTGDMAGLPVDMSRSVSTWPSMAALIPYDMSTLGVDIYGKDKVLVTTADRTYTTSDMFAFIRDLSQNGYYHRTYPLSNKGLARLANGTSVWKYIHESIFSNGTHPGVDIDTVYVSDCPTPSSWTFTKPDLSDGGTASHDYLGDGTVPSESMVIPSKIWSKDSRWRVTLHPLKSQPKSNMHGMSSQHMGTCWHPESIDIVVNLIKGK
jgi:hypothetical protein